MTLAMYSSLVAFSSATFETYYQIAASWQSGLLDRPIPQREALHVQDSLRNGAIVTIVIGVFTFCFCPSLVQPFIQRCRPASDLVAAHCAVMNTHDTPRPSFRIDHNNARNVVAVHAPPNGITLRPGNWTLRL